MVEVIVARVPSWQGRALSKYRKSKKIGNSDMVRFALNYLLLNYRGRINASILDETDFLARQKFGKIRIKLRQPVTVKRK